MPKKLQLDPGKKKWIAGRGRVGRGSPLHCYHKRDIGQPISRDPERCGQDWDSTARTRDGKEVWVDLY